MLVVPSLRGQLGAGSSQPPHAQASNGRSQRSAQRLKSKRQAGTTAGVGPPPAQLAELSPWRRAVPQPPGPTSWPQPPLPLTR